MQESSREGVDLTKYVKDGENLSKNFDREDIPEKNMLARSQDVQISDDEEEEHDPNHYYPNILVADDNPVELKDLVSHMGYIKGPDMKYQTCDFTDDGRSMVLMYKERL